MKKSLIASALALVCTCASAESFFQAEVGIGGQRSRDMGDGIWIQTSPQTPHAENMSGTSYLAGITGPIIERGRWDLRWHLDYVYFGGMSASCLCVPDANYNPVKHVSNEPGYIPFNGGGHVQGVQLLIEPGLTALGARWSVQAGPWLYWQTWHESQISVNPALDALSHKTHMQLGWVVGVAVGKGPWSVSYRYYRESAQWNQYPGMVTGTHMINVTYRF